MVISHIHRYLFIEIPHTASTAISQELRTHYEGKLILHKHANYSEFYTHASIDEKKYFVFGAIRNPLDAIVTEFFKFRNDHMGSYSNPANYALNGGWVEDEHVEKYQFIQRNNGNFEKYFSTYFNKLYNNWFLIGHRRYNVVMRYENIAAEFDLVLRNLDIEPKRPLPVVNKSNRSVSYEALFSPALRLQVVSSFGPYLKQWGYAFPAAWGPQKVPFSAQLKYTAIERGITYLGRFVNLSPRSPFIHRAYRFIKRFL